MATRVDAAPSERPSVDLRLGTTVVVVLFVVAVVLRFWTAGDKNLWLDEAASWDMASRPVDDLLRGVAQDIHPPLYYLMLGGWMALAGDSALALRSLSAIFGVVVVWLGYRLADRRLPRPAALAALAWLAVSPHLVFYSQEARMYAPATALVLAAYLAYRRWIESRLAPRRMLAAFGAAMIGALYLHYFTALVLLALWVHLALTSRRLVDGALGSRARRAWHEWFAVNVALVIAYLPWMPTAFAQITRGQEWRREVSFDDLAFYAGWFSKEALAGYHPSLTPLLVAAFVTLLGVVGTGWALLLVRKPGSPRYDADVCLALVVAIPVAVSLAAMPATGGLGLSRYLAFLVPLVILGTARGASVWMSGWRGPGIVMLGVIASIPWLHAYLQDTAKDVDVRPTVRAIAAQSGPGSGQGVVLVDPGPMGLCLRYYAQDLALQVKAVPRTVGPWQALQAARRQSRDGPLWLVVARDAVSFDPRSRAATSRLEEVTLEPRRPDRIRLFRVVGAG